MDNKSSRFASLNEMRRRSELCDVTLVAGHDQKEMVAHRLVLATTSAFFREHFAVSTPAGGSLQRITLQGIGTASLAALLEHIYTDSVAMINDANVQPLLSAAGLLQLPLLRAACIAHMAATLAPDTCLRIRRAADRHDCAVLRQQANDYIRRNSLGLVQSADFVQLMAAGQASTLDAPEAIVTIAAAKAEITITKDDADKVANAKAAWKPTSRSMLIVDEFRTQMYNFAGERWERCINVRPTGKYIQAAVIQQAELFTFGCDDVYVLNTDTGVWTKNNTLPTNRHFPGIAVLNGSFCAVGGQVTLNNVPTMTSSMLTYAVRIHKWGDAAPMSEIRSGPGVAVLNNQLYAVGGFPNVRSVERYTAPTNSWHQLAPMSVGRFMPGMAVLDGLLYVIGGTTGTVERPLSSAEVYNPFTNMWSRLQDMSVQRSRPAVVVFAGELFVLGGSYDRRVEVFSPATGVWRTLSSLMPEASFSPVACLVEGRPIDDKQLKVETK